MSISKENTLDEAEQHEYCGWEYLYDDPLEALIIGDITSPRYPGHDAWERWKHEHYVGDSAGVSEGVAE